MKRVSLAILALAVLFSGHTEAGETKPVPLGHYGIEAQPITVSGLSSGGYMAVQLAIAHSSVFSGVAVVAGGPYGCAYTGSTESVNAARALGPCMAGQYGLAATMAMPLVYRELPGSGSPGCGRERSSRAPARQSEVDRSAGAG